jgi:hypothetical protein
LEFAGERTLPLPKDDIRRIKLTGKKINQYIDGACRHLFQYNTTQNTDPVEACRTGKQEQRVLEFKEGK